MKGKLKVCATFDVVSFQSPVSLAVRWVVKRLVSPGTGYNPAVLLKVARRLCMFFHLWLADDFIIAGSTGAVEMSDDPGFRDLSGAMAIVNALIANGVKTVFGQSGAQMYAPFDASSAFEWSGSARPPSVLERK